MASKVDNIAPISIQFAIEETKKQLSPAEEIFKHFANIKTEERSQMLASLKESSMTLAQIDLSSLIEAESSAILELTKISSRVLYLLGRSFYGQSMETSRQFFLLAMGVQTAADKALMFSQVQNILKSDNLSEIETLDQLKNYMSGKSDNELFANLENSILSTNKPNLVKSSESDPEQAFTTASIYRWLGHSIQNIDRYKTVNSYALFVKIYDLSIAVLSKIKTQDSDLEIAHVKYNAGRFVHKLLHADDNVGALETLKPVEEILAQHPQHAGATQLRAQIHNIRTLENFGEEKAAEGTSERKQQLYRNFLEVSKSRQIAEEFEGFDSFLKAMFLHNKARIAQQCWTAEVEDAPNLETIDNWMTQALKEREATNFNHIYDSAFLRNGAEISGKLAVEKFAKGDIHGFNLSKTLAEFRLAKAEELDAIQGADEFDLKVKEIETLIKNLEEAGDASDQIVKAYDDFEAAKKQHKELLQTIEVKKQSANNFRSKLQELEAAKS
jgi:exonuclease VII small subunit